METHCFSLSVGNRDVTQHAMSRKLDENWMEIDTKLYLKKKYFYYFYNKTK